MKIKCRKYLKAAVKILITISPLRIYTTFILNGYLKRITNEEVMMICTGGIGDTVMSCLIIDQFIKMNSKKDKVFLIKASHHDIVKFIHPNACCEIISNRMMRWIELTYKPIKKPSYSYNSKYIYGEFSILDELRSGEENFIDDFKNRIFGLSNSSCMKEISEKVQQIENANKILLAPYTVSIRYETTNFWINMADDLQKKGYEVYTNTINEDVIEGTKSLSVSLIELVEKLKEYKAVISYRSGLNDWLEILGVRQIILYQNSDICRYYNTSSMQIDSKTKNIVLHSDENMLRNTILKEIEKKT